MPNTTKSNKLKRKRGKKFVWHGSRDVNEDKEANVKKLTQAEKNNPFEDHEKSKRARKDLDKRQELLNDFRRINKNSVIVDNRIGETSSKMSEEDKMKLRYMREQRDRARELLQNKTEEIDDKRHSGTTLNVKTSRKRTKYQLNDSDSDGDGDVFSGFTHGGKALNDDGVRDDYNENIDQDSDDDKNDRNKRKGFLGDDIVAQMNFGGFDGDQQGQFGENGAGPPVKKTRKEVFEEIMEKSKNYDAARKELK